MQHNSQRLANMERDRVSVFVDRDVEAGARVGGWAAGGRRDNAGRLAARGEEEGDHPENEYGPHLERNAPREFRVTHQWR